MLLNARPTFARVGAALGDDLADDPAKPGAGNQGCDELTNVHEDRPSGLTRRTSVASTAATAAGVLWKEATVLAAETGTDKDKATRSTRDWADLRGRIKREVITADAPDFAAVRSELVWNELKPDRSPDVIVRVMDDQDVVEAVNFVRENGLKVVVRGGGHTWCGLAVRLGGMTIDLSASPKARSTKRRQRR